MQHSTVPSPHETPQQSKPRNTLPPQPETRIHILSGLPSPHHLMAITTIPVTSFPQPFSSNRTAFPRTLLSPETLDASITLDGNYPTLSVPPLHQIPLSHSSFHTFHAHHYPSPAYFTNHLLHFHSQQQVQSYLLTKATTFYHTLHHRIRPPTLDNAVSELRSRTMRLSRHDSTQAHIRHNLPMHMWLITVVGYNIL